MNKKKLIMEHDMRIQSTKVHALTNNKQKKPISDDFDLNILDGNIDIDVSPGPTRNNSESNIFFILSTNRI